MKHFGFVFVSLLLCISPGIVVQAQSEKPLPVCTQAAFAAFKSLPKLEYECPEGETNYSDEILKLPARLAAIHKLELKLESFTSAAWWNRNVEELNNCEIHGSTGKLTAEEEQKLKDGDYTIQLLGNHQIRLVLLLDPCYQTEFAGSNAFLLYRDGGRVVVSQVLNGYASRVGNSVGVDFATLSGRKLIEVSTANSVPPTVTNYYFVIEPGTNRAVASRLFQYGNRRTNEIYSDMLMGEPKEFGLPKEVSELNIIRNGRLVQTFSAYQQDEHGDVDGRLRRIVYRWNGKFFVPLPKRRSGRHERRS